MSSDTIAREQQIRELNHQKKSISNSVQPNNSKAPSNEIMFIAFIHIIIAVLILTSFIMNNEALIQEAYHGLIDTSDEVLEDTPLLFK